LLGRQAFNLASQSQSIYYDTLLLRKYLPTLTALKTVVLPVSYFSLDYELDEAPERWRAYHYFYFYGLPHKDWHGFVSARNFSAYFLSGESTRLRVLTGRALNAANEYDGWGGWTNRACPHPVGPGHSEQLQGAARATLNMHHRMMNPAHAGANIERLEETIRSCKSRGLRPILLTSPVTRYYAQGMNQPSWSATRDKIPYLDYSQDARFSDADFADGDHLNCTGAEKFSRILREEMPAP
jgi:hypothetical protein